MTAAGFFFGFPIWLSIPRIWEKVQNYFTTKWPHFFFCSAIMYGPRKKWSERSKYIKYIEYFNHAISLKTIQG